MNESLLETMSGESDLTQLLRNMRPQLDQRVFVFCSVDAATLRRISVNTVGSFYETEGTTLILDKTEADTLSLRYDSVWSLITLSVHSELTAVGFLAAVTTQLASAGISVNAVSGYYHDHLFVPNADRERAIQELADLSNRS